MMKKVLLPLILIAGALVATTGIGAGLINTIDKKLGVRSLEQRIVGNIEDLKSGRTRISEQAHLLRSKMGQEESRVSRSNEERMKLDAACIRLAAKLNENSNSITFNWGTHELTRPRGLQLLEEWGKQVDELDKTIEASRAKAVSYKTAVAKLDGDAQRFQESVAKLEVKLNELLVAKEVLTVQKQVGEILAAAAGRDVPGATAELMTELQSENDKLRGAITAYGYSPSNDSMVDPDDDLNQTTISSIRQRYGIVEPTATASTR